MSTDRELLELAARATECSGYTHEWINGPEFVIPGENPVVWDPLRDDGDAFRLAVQLGLWIHIGKYHTAIEGTHIEETARRGDSLAATRRAIVRAAAEIGKDMK